MTIEIKYFEQGQPDSLLGRERFEDIEEALLPYPSTDEAPRFFSKKFVGRQEYRWKVISVNSKKEDTVSLFTVVLEPKIQVEKEACLLNIVKKRAKSLKAVLPRGSFVEVEYGHPMSVGKATGTIHTNKRYPETLQRGSMHKRRLAIVLDTKFHGKGVVQVVPITSKKPMGDKSAIDVTLWISDLADYPKASWAICSMVESVSPSRIFAPNVRFKGGVARDTGFNVRAGKSQMACVDAALVHGIALQELFNKQQQENVSLSTKVATLQADIAVASSALQAAADEARLREEFVKHVEQMVGGSLTDEWETFLQSSRNKRGAIV